MVDFFFRCLFVSAGKFYDLGFDWDWDLMVNLGFFFGDFGIWVLIRIGFDNFAFFGLEMVCKVFEEIPM